MISATSLNAQSALNKGPQIPLGLDSSRMRGDSQKFLVPSLPVSARAVGNHHSSDPKRRERSIVNGTAHPPPPPNDNHYSHHLHHHPHHHQQQQQQQQQQQHNSSHNYPSHNINGLRPSYNSPHGGGSNSNSSHNNNSNNLRVSPHHPYSHLNNSPRKDAHSPMYAGEVPGLNSAGAGGNYSTRLSMPIPCSSPAQASSASPKGSHSHSPSSGTPTGGGNYSPKLPSGPAMLPPPPAGSAELTSLAAAGRLYSGFPHPSVAALSPFYAAAAAAAANHSISYPFFASHYNPHSHPAAAASAYLDSFHSTLANRGGPVERQQQRSRSPSPPPSRVQVSSYHLAQSQLQQQQQHQHQQQSHHHGSSPQSTSVTSFHTKLIESTAVSSDRHIFNGHHHSNHAHHHSSNGDSYSPGTLGISKGGPLGISGGIINLPSSRMSNGTSPQKAVAHAENLSVHKSVNMNGYNGPSKQWVEHPGLNSADSMSRRTYAEMEAKDTRQINHKEMFKESQLKHRIISHLPEEKNSGLSPPSKISKTITFASNAYPPPSNMANANNNRSSSSISYSHINGNGHLHVSSSPSNPGILTDSNNAKKQVSNQQISHQPQLIHPQQNPFLPPSPKKRSGNWNFAVPASPTTKHDLLPPPPPPPLNTVNPTVQNSLHEPSKYLNSNQNQNHKPSNLNHSLPAPNSSSSIIYNTNNNTTYLSSGQSAQHSPYPASPRQPGSGPSTPKSPSVHQVKFSFTNGNSKENMNGVRNGNKSGRNDSSSSNSSNESAVPWPVEQMPLLEAFRRGSLIKLASGDLIPVEDLRAEDFIHAVASVSDSLRIIHCTVLSIQGEGSNGNSMCKVTLAIGSQVQNQQVVMPSTPEQPFFVVGRGWSSLSPKTTEKLLQLPCNPLSVGDVCITLTKGTSSKNQSNNNSNRSQSQVPKSPAIKNKGNGLNSGKSRNSANTASNNTNNSSHTANASVKRSQQITHDVPNTPCGQEGRSAVPDDNQQQILRMTVKNGQVDQSASGKAISKNCMGPPLSSTTSATTFSKLNSSEMEIEKMDTLRPPSPKRRRWSAPEPEILVAGSEEESPIKRKNVTPPPSALVHRDNNDHPSGGDKEKADEKSNLNRKTPDAQSAKA